MVCIKKRKPVFIKRKWNHVVFSRATILSFHPVFFVIYLQSGLNQQMISLFKVFDQMPISVTLCVLLENSEWILGTHKPLSTYEILLITTKHDFYLSFFLLISKLDLLNRSLWPKESLEIVYLAYQTTEWICRILFGWLKSFAIFS